MALVPCNDRPDKSAEVGQLLNVGGVKALQNSFQRHTKAKEAFATN